MELDQDRDGNNRFFLYASARARIEPGREQHDHDHYWYERLFDAYVHASLRREMQCLFYVGFFSPVNFGRTLANINFQLIFFLSSRFSIFEFIVMCI